LDDGDEFADEFVELSVVEPHAGEVVAGAFPGRVDVFA
jgi:hypothetical protein